MDVNAGATERCVVGKKDICSTERNLLVAEMFNAAVRKYPTNGWPEIKDVKPNQIELQQILEISDGEYYLGGIILGVFVNGIVNIEKSGDAWVPLQAKISVSDKSSYDYVFFFRRDSTDIKVTGCRKV